MFWNRKHEERGAGMTYEVTESDDEWRTQLGPDRFAVLRQKPPRGAPIR